MRLILPRAAHRIRYVVSSAWFVTCDQPVADEIPYLLSVALAKHSTE